MTTSYKVGNLTFGNAVRQISELFDIADQHILLDFSRVNKRRSAGMTHFVAGIESLRSSGKKFYIAEDAPYMSSPSYGLKYAANMGLFDALNFEDVPIGKKIGSLTGNDNYLPLNKITWDNLYSESKDYHMAIEIKAKELAHVLASGSNSLRKFENTLQYMLRELIRNTFEHAGGNIEHVWIAAQNHPSEGKTEIGISDSGMGIFKSLTINPTLRETVTDDKTALLYSIRPGISGKGYKLSEGDWSNSGFGLYVTSSIFNKLGEFEVVSGFARLLVKNNNKQSGLAKFQGTSYTAVINHDKVRSIPENIIPIIVEKGEEEAKLDSFAIKTASKASKLA